MTDFQTPAPKPDASPNLKTLTHIAYGLYALGVLSSGFLGVATIAAVILLYIKRPDAAGTIYASHFDWLLRTFWWALLWLAISLIASLIFIGWLGVAATIIWVVYRLVRGWLAVFADKPPAAYE